MSDTETDLEHEAPKEGPNAPGEKKLSAAKKSPRAKAARHLGKSASSKGDRIIRMQDDAKQGIVLQFSDDEDAQARDIDISKKGVVPTVSSAAHAIATARCNRIVRQAAPWWIRSGAHDASSILILQLKEIYEQLRVQHVENELTREELARLRDKHAAANCAGSAAIHHGAQLEVALKTEKLKTIDLEGMLQTDVLRRKQAEDSTAAATAALEASARRQSFLQHRHDQIRNACDQAYALVAQTRKKGIMMQLRTVFRQKKQETEKVAADDRAKKLEEEVIRLNSVDSVNAALVSEIKQLHIELHSLRMEIAQYKGNADTLIFKTQNDPNKLRPRVTAVSVLTNMYKRHKRLERRNTLDKAHNEQLMSQLKGMTCVSSPVKSEVTAGSALGSFVSEHGESGKDSSPSLPARLRQDIKSSHDLCRMPTAANSPAPRSIPPSQRQSAWDCVNEAAQKTAQAAFGSPSRPQTPSKSPGLPRSSSGLSTSSRQRNYPLKFKPVPKSQSYRGSPHVIRPKDQREKERKIALKRRLNYQPSNK